MFHKSCQYNNGGRKLPVTSATVQFDLEISGLMFKQN